MKNRTVKTRLIILPLALSALTLGACSQTQNDPGVATSTKGGKTTASNASKNGTVGAGNASRVTSNSSRGANANNGNRGNYLPNNNANSNVNDGRDLTLAGLKDPNNLLSQRVIYFDYNQASIRPEYMVLLNTHAQLAAKYPQLRMRLEGHADERGSREYNVALSEQRASSVKRIMGTQGARGGQIKTIGYGEEIPLVRGHNKKSWQKNRRVEIKYDNY